MLNDRQLENLVRMAAEIEAMDALASGQPALRLAGEPARPVGRSSANPWKLSRGWSVALAAIATAAAACVALIFVPGGTTTGSGAPSNTSPNEIVAAPLPQNPDLWSGPGAAWPPAPPWPFNGEPIYPEAVAEMVPASHVEPEIRGALLAIIEDDAGHIECVKWAEHDWGQGRTLAEAKASELVALSLMMACDRTPRRMTVVGLRGPVSELPLGDARAAEFASCVVKAPARCSAQTCCNAGAASDCIPDDVTARFERVSLR